MGLFGGKKEVNLVGLDIGSSSVKAVELKKTKDGFELLSVGLEPLSPETVVDGAIIDALSVSAAIDRIYAGQKVKNKNVATSVSGHSVIIKKINLPMLEEDELYDQVYADAGQYIPFDIADVSLDYQVLEPSPAGDTQEVLLVAVKRDKINNYQSALIGRTLAMVDVDAFALQNTYETNYQPNPDETAALLRSVSEILVLEIQKTFDFFRATAGAAAIGHIYAAGGAARTPGLLDMLKEEFQMPVDELDPFRRVTYNPAKFSDEYVKEIAPRLAVCVGLGLRSFDEA